MARFIAVLGGGISGYGSAILAKKQGFEVLLSDMGQIAPHYRAIEAVEGAVAEFASYIGQQTLAVSVKTAAEPSGEFVVDSDVNDIPLKIAIKKA